MIQHVTYDNLLKRYAHYASNYDRRFARYSQATLRHALRVIPLHETRSLLDVACGTGLLAEMLRSVRPNLHITGVDVSPDMLARAKQRIPPTTESDVEWKQGFAENLPVKSEAFDVVTCTNAFHLIQDAPTALREFRRVLKPGGELVLVDWCTDFPVMQVRDLVLRVIDRQKRAIRTLDELSSLVQEAGLPVQVQERFLATPVWGMMCVVARKPVNVPSAWRTSEAKPTRATSSVR
jgi:ubiquinone/menaquinone biosynthesis C-methylase UbiE